jgi:predicted NAD/FAD-dependent oxidoreductase
MALKNPPENIAIIGAGMAGLTCATSLQLAGPKITVFEQAFHPGGRMSVFRKQGHEFDDGLQYFTVQDERFQWTVDAWLDEGVIEIWDGWCVDLEAGNFLRREASAPRYVGIPNMSALGSHLAGLCQIEYGCRVTKIAPCSQGWTLKDQFARDLGVFDRVILAIPPRVARPLIEGLSSILEEGITKVSMTHVWALLLSFDEPTGLLFDAAFVAQSPLDWIARNNSKPKRGVQENWVAISTPEWTEQYQNYSQQEIQALLLQAFDEATGGINKEPTFQELRYWDDAKTIQTLDADYLYDADKGIGLCGDWCLGTRLESAFLSGLGMANEIIDQT